MGNKLQELADCGQSIWLDYIRRNMFASGEMRRLVDQGLGGMTSNPTIFEKAVAAGDDYDDQIRKLAGSIRDPHALFEALAIDDIRCAADALRPTYDRLQGADGFISLEVSPLLAHDTAGTIAAAKRLWKTVDRPNVMIKIPGTPEGVPAITEAIAAGININVTLIFSLEAYEATANAYIAGLERRVARGESIANIASVNSVFVSRIDTAVDKLLQEKIDRGEPLRPLLGKIGVANLKLTYQRFKELFGAERFTKLVAKGARVQRPLWASTGTKNPTYSDLLYVENVVAEHTVNTVPPATLDALLDHLTVRLNSIEEDIDGARETVAAIARAQISLSDVTHKLQEDGVKLFADSYAALLAGVEKKVKALLGERPALVTIDPGKTPTDLESPLQALAQSAFLEKLWAHDPAPWTNDPKHAEIIKHALGWLDFPQRVLDDVEDLVVFSSDIAREFAHVVVLGMGGSSLAPDVLRATFGRTQGFPLLHILDSSDPAQIKTLDDVLDLPRTLFIVASKSGTTIEPDAFMRYFFQRVQNAVASQPAGRQFIAITDPGTALAEHARRDGFRRVFLNDPDIGGRYSALSYFGIVPAALAGYDVRLLLNRGITALLADKHASTSDRAEGVRLGSALAAFAKAGRDKLTIVAHPQIASFGAWCEQLIAESTGKSGLGIVPIEGEPLGEPQAYGTDRLFAYIGDGLSTQPTIDAALGALSAAGHPIVRIRMNDAYDIGAQFALWEIATATAGAALGIDAFDQPNVQESKDNTKRLLDDHAKNGVFAEPAAQLETPTATLTRFSGSAAGTPGATLSEALARIFAQCKPGDYVAITAYIEMNEDHQRALHEIRLKIRNALRVATTVGFGPRFLHSTGQLHKGGPNTGIFLQLTADPPIDFPIPGTTTFKTLERAQALGDFESLNARKRRGARLHFTVALQQSLAALSNAVDAALAIRA